MNIRENIMMSVQNIRRNRLRSFLSVFSILLGVAFCIVAFSTGDAGAAYIRSEFQNVGEKTVRITVSPFETAAAEQISFDDVQLMKEKIRGVAYASPFMRFQGEIRSLDSQEKLPTEIVAGNQDLQYAFSSGISSGRYFNADEFRDAAQVALLNEDAAKALFGFENVIGRRVEVTVNSKRVRLTVIGLLRDENKEYENGICLTVPATTLINTIGGDERSDMCYLVAEDKQAMSEIGALAEHFLGVRHNNYEENIYRSANAAQNAEMMARVQTAADALAAVMACITLLLGGIGVMSVMLLSVAHRAKEIGIRKALGAKRRDILSQFLAESMILSLVGGILGCVVGVLAAFALGAVLGHTAALSLHALLIPLLFSVAVGFIFGIVPARRAEKLQPIDALRRE